MNKNDVRKDIIDMYNSWRNAALYGDIDDDVFEILNKYDIKIDEEGYVED